MTTIDAPRKEARMTVELPLAFAPLQGREDERGGPDRGIAMSLAMAMFQGKDRKEHGDFVLPLALAGVSDKLKGEGGVPWFAVAPSEGQESTSGKKGRLLRR